MKYKIHRNGIYTHFPIKFAFSDNLCLNELPQLKHIQNVQYFFFLSLFFIDKYYTFLLKEKDGGMAKHLGFHF